MDEQNLSQAALDSAKSAHKRIDTLEREVGDLRDLTVAVKNMGTKIEYVEKGVAEIRMDVKAITAKPGKLQDKIVAAVVVALATGLIGAVLALIVK